MVLVKIELGVLSRGQLGPAEIIAEYVRDNTMSKVHVYNYAAYNIHDLQGIPYSG